MIILTHIILDVTSYFIFSHSFLFMSQLLFLSFFSFFLCFVFLYHFIYSIIKQKYLVDVLANRFLFFIKITTKKIIKNYLLFKSRLNLHIFKQIKYCQLIFEIFLLEKKTSLDLFQFHFHIFDFLFCYGRILICINIFNWIFFIIIIFTFIDFFCCT